MPAAAAVVSEYIGTFFATSGTAAAGTAAATAGTTAAGTAAAGTAAAGAAAAGETAVGATVAAAGGAGAIAGAAPLLPGIAAGVGDLTAAQLAAYSATAATGVSALTTLARGAPSINIPPAPQMQLGADQAAQQAEQQSLQRAQAAGGLQSTTGTAGGQAGAILNPSTLSNRTLLGG